MERVPTTEEDVELELEPVSREEVEAEEAQEEARGDKSELTGNAHRTPLEPSTDPCACICEEYIVMPKIGHQYVLYQSRNRHTELSVGPHWTGMVYTATLTLASTIAYLVQQCPTLPGYCSAIAVVMCTAT